MEKYYYSEGYIYKGKDTYFSVYGSIDQQKEFGKMIVDFLNKPKGVTENKSIANKIVNALTERPVIYMDSERQFIDQNADSAQCVRITKEVLDKWVLEN